MGQVDDGRPGVSPSSGMGSASQTAREEAPHSVAQRTSLEIRALDPPALQREVPPPRADEQGPAAPACLARRMGARRRASP